MYNPRGRGRGATRGKPPGKERHRDRFRPPDGLAAPPPPSLHLPSSSSSSLPPLPRDPDYYTEEERLAKQRWENLERHREEIRRRSEIDLIDTRPHSKTPKQRHRNTRELPPVDPSRRDSVDSRGGGGGGGGGIGPGPGLGLGLGISGGGGGGSMGGGLSSVEPSPRERGMIDNPSTNLHRRTPSITWSRGGDEERLHDAGIERGPRSRASSIDKRVDGQALMPNTGGGGGDVVMESPTNFHFHLPPPQLLESRPESPMIGLNDRRQSHGSTSKPDDSNDGALFARIFMEAAYAYSKDMQADTSLKLAQGEYDRKKEYFTHFKVMKDRLEGVLNQSRKEKSSTNEELNKKSGPLNELLTKVVKEHLCLADLESIEPLIRRLAKDLVGFSSLDDYVGNIVKKQPLADDVAFLRREVRDLWKRQKEDEGYQQKELDDLVNSQNKRWREQDQKIKHLESTQVELKSDIERMKNDNRKSTEELHRMLELIETLRNSVGTAKENNATLPKGITWEKIAQRLESLENNVSTNQKDLRAANQKLSQYNIQMDCLKKESKTYAERVKILEQETDGAKATEKEKDVNVVLADIQRLQDQISVNLSTQDNSLALLQEQQDESTTQMFSAIEIIEKSVEEKIAKFTGDIDALKAQQEQALSQFESEIKASKDSSSEELAKVTKNIQDLAIQNPGPQPRTPQAEIARDMQDKIDFVENSMEALSVAINHLDQRMNNFSSKDFFDRLMQQLNQSYPQLLDFGNRLVLLTAEQKKVSAAVQNLMMQARQHHNKPPTTPSSDSADPDLNGFKRFDAGNFPTPTTSAEFCNQLLSMRAELQKIDARLSDHVQVYTKKMDDIKEWTISATQRLEDNTNSAAAIMDDIRQLRGFWTHHQGDTLPSPSAEVNRWRVVAGNPEPIQGLPEDDRTGPSAAYGN